MSLTIEQLFRNPSGTGSSFFTSRQALLNDLNVRLHKIMNRANNNKFGINLYDIGGEYVFHVMVPSETLNKIKNDFKWDVLILLPQIPKTKSDFKTINVKVFSNSPAFIYTDCFAYKKNGSLIPWSSSLIPVQAVSQRPSIKNPESILGFNKSITFACLILEGGQFIFKRGLKEIKRDKNFITSGMSPFDEKMEEYNKLLLLQRKYVREQNKSEKEDSVALISQATKTNFRTTKNRTTGIKKPKKPKSAKRPI